MLDLSFKEKELYEVRWVDGQVLHLNPPSQKTYLEIIGLQKQTDPTLQLAGFYDTISVIINNNAEKRVIENIEIPLDVCVLLLEDYFNFYTEQMKEINFQKSQQ